jgi:hypothetical protein
MSFGKEVTVFLGGAWKVRRNILLLSTTRKKGNGRRYVILWNIY